MAHFAILFPVNGEVNMLASAFVSTADDVQGLQGHF